MLSKRLTQIVATVVYLLFHYAALAQQSAPDIAEPEQNVSNTSDSTSSGEADDNNSVTTPKDTKPKTTVDSKFDPSEEISEDLSVPFPVDI